MRVQTISCGRSHSVVPLIPIADTDTSDPVIDLSGQWHASVSGHDHSKTVVTVPGECFLQGMQIDEDSTVLLRTRFVLPEDWQGYRVVLRIDCVHGGSQVWLNGTDVGTDDSAFLPTAYDLTENCVWDSENELVIASTSGTTADEIAKASQYADHPLTGILRQIRLLRLPDIFPAGLIVQTRLDGAGAASVQIDGVLAGHRLNASDSTSKHIRAELFDQEAHTASMATVSHDTTSPFRYTLTFKVDSPRLWSPEDPFCYTLLLHTGDGTHSARYERRIGLRTVEVTGTTVRVNGNPVKLRGVCRHDAHPTAGRAYVPGLCDTDVELFRNANVNFIRTSHYPPNEELVDATDAAGIFVEVEAPVCWAFGFAPYDNSDRRSMPWDELSRKEQATWHDSIVSSCLRMLHLYGDHPSVMIWSLANESLWAPPFETAARALDQIDPGRLRTFNWADYREDDAAFCQIAVHHYPGPEGLAKYATSTRPMLFDEYCHINCYNRSELETDPGVRDLWWQAISAAWDAIRSTPAFLGGSVWSGVDECFSSQDGRLIGYGHWGVISGDRHTKPEHYHLRKAYSPVKLVIRNARVVPGQRYLIVPVETQLASELLSKYELYWRCGDDSGILSINELSGTDRRELKIPLPATANEARAPVCFEVRSPSGQVIDEETLRSDHVHVDPGTDNAVLRSADVPVESCEPFVVPRHFVAEPKKLTDYKPIVLQNQCGTLCADGSFSWSHSENASGHVDLTYRWTVRESVDPWQAGVVLRLKSPVVRLEWTRSGDHSCYPDNHVGRTQGSVSRSEQDSPDWIATKRNVTEVHFETSDGTCFSVQPSGPAHLRVLPGGSAILLLSIAAAGSEPFVEPYYRVHTLESGDTVSGTWTISSSHYSERKGR